MLHDLLRTTDAPCRYGGEEFALVLSETDEAGAVLTAERIRQHLAGHAFRPTERQVHAVTASFGVASSSMFDRQSLSVSTLVTAADGALYRAKNEGRNRVCVAKQTAEQTPHS
jgi:diguanylate cyclase (GGDEF)-like protein